MRLLRARMGDLMTVWSLSGFVGKRRRLFYVGVRPLVFALAAQGLVFGVAFFVVVIGPVFQSEPDFVAGKTIYLPQRELEHRMAVAEFEQAAQPPAMLSKLTTSNLTPSSLPRLPVLPPLDSVNVATQSPLLDPGVLSGHSGLLGALSGVRTETSSFSLFGLKEEATKVIICFDISTSVKNKVEGAGYSMQQVQAATREAVEQLNANTLFGFIQFARNYDRFRPYLVAATRANKDSALTWLENEFRTDGRAARGWHRANPNGIQSVLRAAFDLDPQPDVIIVLSDGAFWRSTASGSGERVPWDELSRDLAAYQAVLPKPVRLHFIGFQMRPADRTALNGLVRRYGGQLREID